MVERQGAHALLNRRRIVVELAEFTAVLPAWCGDDGMPRSLQHFMAGLVAMERMRVARSWETSKAGRAAQASEKGWKEWAEEKTRYLNG